MKPSVGPFLLRYIVNGRRRAVGVPALEESESVLDRVVPHALGWRYGGGVVQCLGK